MAVPTRVRRRRAGPVETVRLKERIHLHAREPAYFTFDENEKGAIAEDILADFVVVIGRHPQRPARHDPGPPDGAGLHRRPRNREHQRTALVRPCASTETSKQPTDVDRIHAASGFSPIVAYSSHDDSPPRSCAIPTIRVPRQSTTKEHAIDKIVLSAARRQRASPAPTAGNSASVVQANAAGSGDFIVASHGSGPLSGNSQLLWETR